MFRHTQFNKFRCIRNTWTRHLGSLVKKNRWRRFLYHSMFFRHSFCSMSRAASSGLTTPLPSERPTADYRLSCAHNTCQIVLLRIEFAPWTLFVSHAVKVRRLHRNIPKHKGSFIHLRHIGLSHIVGGPRDQAPVSFTIPSRISCPYQPQQHGRKGLWKLLRNSKCRSVTCCN